MLAEYKSASFSTGRMNKLRQTDNLERGFTLVELMVTVAIMGVVAAFAVPNMTRQIAEGRMKKTARTFESTLKDAKAESLIRRKDVTVEYTEATTTAEGTLKIFIGSGTDKDTDPITQYSLNSNSKIEMTQTPVPVTSEIVFKPSKTVDKKTTYTVCDKAIEGETSITVKVDKTSNISVTRGGVCTS